ncbi:MAG: transglutaminase family protein, partial [Defluviitaleaceae bacterium]|nr:transglutaminase family protein [Defluviitaleaceae bacterium]
MDLKIFLAESKYIDFSSPNIQKKAAEIFQQTSTNTEYAKAAYEYVRDKIAHTFDIAIKPFRATAKASDVLKHGTGICHAKSNLLAALLRSRGIPTGFCFQHITLEDDDSAGYCIHCYNAIFLDIDPPIEVCQANSNHPPKRGDCDTNIAERFNW